MISETVITVKSDGDKWRILIDEMIRAAGTFNPKGVPIIDARNEVLGRIDAELIFTLLELHRS